MTDQPIQGYTLRMRQPVNNTALRQQIAGTIAPQLQLSLERADHLLSITGNLMKPLPLKEAERIALVFNTAGAQVDLVPVTAAPEMTKPLESENQANPVQARKGRSGFALPRLKRATVAPPKPETSPTSAIRPKGWISLRWKLLVLVLTPMLLVGMAWVFTAFSTQARTDRDRLAQGAVQAAAIFSDATLTQRIVDADDFTFDNPLITNDLQDRLSTLVEKQLLPLEFAAVTNSRGEVVAVVTKESLGQNAASTALTDPVGTFRERQLDEFEITQAMAFATAQYQRLKEGTDSITLNPTDPLGRVVTGSNGKRFLLVGYPLNRSVGSVMLAIPYEVVNTQVNRTITNTLLQLALALVIVALLAGFLASGHTRRLTQLSTAADAISRGDFELQINNQGQDEVGDLANSLQRLQSALEVAMSRFTKTVS